MWIRIILIVISLFMLTRTVSRFRKNEVRFLSLLAWMLFWLSIGVAGVMPELTNYAANILGVGRGADFVLYLSILTLFYLLFRIFVRLERMEKDMTKIVREGALKADSRKETANVKGN